MYIPPKRRLIRLIAIVWIAAIVVLALVYGIFFSPLSPAHECTLIGCQDMLEMSLSREPAGQYTIVLTSSTGESRTVTCTGGEISMPDNSQALCQTGSVSIYGFTPAEVTVEVRWQGGSYATSGNPRYETMKPNGPDCPPACRVGKLSLELP